MNKAITDYALQTIRRHPEPPRPVNTGKVFALAWSAIMVFLFLLGLIGLFGSLYNINRYMGIETIRLGMSMLGLCVSLLFISFPIIEFIMLYLVLRSGAVKTVRITSITKLLESSNRKEVEIEGRWQYDEFGSLVEDNFSGTGSWAVRAKVGDRIRVVMYPSNRPRIIIPLERDATVERRRG